MAKINVSYEKLSRQSEHSLCELLNLKRQYVAAVDALCPNYRKDCNRNRDMYTAEALDAQRKQAKDEYSRKRLELFDELYRGVGNKLTVAGTEQMIKETEAQIKELSAAVDQADAKIRTLRQSIQAAGTGAPIAKTTQQVKEAAPAVESVSRATREVKANLDSASKRADNFSKAMKKATSSGSSGMSYLARSVKGMATSFVLFGLTFSASQAISDSIGHIAQENESVNNTLSEIKSSLQFVADSLAAVI